MLRNIYEIGPFLLVQFMTLRYISLARYSSPLGILLGKLQPKSLGGHQPTDTSWVYQNTFSYLPVACLEFQIQPSRRHLFIVSCSMRHSKSSSHHFQSSQRVVLPGNRLLPSKQLSQSAHRTQYSSNLN